MSEDQKTAYRSELEVRGYVFHDDPVQVQSVLYKAGCSMDIGDIPEVASNPRDEKDAWVSVKGYQPPRFVLVSDTSGPHNRLDRGGWHPRFEQQFSKEYWFTDDQPIITALLLSKGSGRNPSLAGRIAVRADDPTDVWIQMSGVSDERYHRV